MCRSECEVCRGECEVCRGSVKCAGVRVKCAPTFLNWTSTNITSVHECAIMCVDACVHVLKGCCLFPVHCCEAMHKVPLCSSQHNVTSPFFYSVL